MKQDNIGAAAAAAKKYGTKQTEKHVEWKINDEFDAKQKLKLHFIQLLFSTICNRSVTSSIG